MLESLSNFFDWFQEIFSSIFTFIKSILTAPLEIFKIIPTVFSYLINSIGNLPTILISFATMTIVISVVYLIAGREQGG